MGRERTRNGQTLANKSTQEVCVCRFEIIAPRSDSPSIGILSHLEGRLKTVMKPSMGHPKNLLP